MKNLKKLSKKDLSNILGGRACSVSVQQSNGSWVTYSGTCRAPQFFGSGPYYCETGRGPLAITSNGGVSRCNNY